MVEKSQVSLLSKALEIAVRIRDFDSLGLPVRIGNRELRLSSLDIGRGDLQAGWVSAMKWAQASFLQHVEPALKTPDLATGYYAKLVNEWVKSEEWRQVYAGGILSSLSQGELKRADLQLAAKALDAAAVFVGSILRAVVVDGYRFERNANDAFDHKQLHYLCRSDLLFVTDDKPLRLRVAASIQNSRIMSLDDFLQGVAMVRN